MLWKHWTNEFGVIEFQYFSREAVWPDRFRVQHALDNIRHLVDGGLFPKR